MYILLAGKLRFIYKIIHSPLCLIHHNEEALFGAFKIHLPANVYTGRGLFTFPKSFIIFNTAIFITVVINRLSKEY